MVAIGPALVVSDLRVVSLRGSSCWTGFRSLLGPGAWNDALIKRVILFFHDSVRLQL